MAAADLAIPAGPLLKKSAGGASAAGREVAMSRHHQVCIRVGLFLGLTAMIAACAARKAPRRPEQALDSIHVPLSIVKDLPYAPGGGARPPAFASTFTPTPTKVSNRWW